MCLLSLREAFNVSITALVAGAKHSRASGGGSDVLVLQSSQMNQNAKVMCGALKEQTKMAEDINSQMDRAHGQVGKALLTT